MAKKTSFITPATLGTPRRSLAPEDSVVSHNLSEMNGSMMRLLKTESIGGNAGRVKLGGKYYSCAAANGYADPRSGKIVEFGNFQNISPERRDNNAAFTLRAACSTRRFFRIVQLLTDDRGGGRKLAPGAREVLEESVRRWNESRA
jgi:hypothetical protein